CTRQKGGGSKELITGGSLDQTAGFVPGSSSLLGRGWIADTDRRSDGFGLENRVAQPQRSGARSLEPPHPRCSHSFAGRRVLLITTPVRRDIPGVANGNHMQVGSIPQLVDHFEGGGFLTLDPVGIDRVYQRDRIDLDELAGEFQTVVEVAVDLHDLGTV